MKNRLQTTYCPTNEAIQIVGERWALLVVRDLLYGPRRFSDLLATITGITPKLLTLRLRELEASGVIHRDEAAGRRDVWYSLTGAGEALRPVIRELAGWGVRFGTLPEPGDSIMSRRAAATCSAVLNRQNLYPDEPVVWSIDLGDGEPGRLAYDGRHWDPLPESDRRSPEIAITADSRTFVEMLRANGKDRAARAKTIQADGTEVAIAKFHALFTKQAH